MSRGWMTMVLGVSIAFGCNDAEEGPDYATEVQPIWEDNCLCHAQGPSGAMTAPYLTLATGNEDDDNAELSHAELVGVASSDTALMGALNRVEPGDVEASYLWAKLNDTQDEVGGSGTQMPQGSVLEQPDLDIIERWIEAGAAR